VEHKIVSIDLIDKILHKLLQNENNELDKSQTCRVFASMVYTTALLSTSVYLVHSSQIENLLDCLSKKLKVKNLKINSQDISNIIWSLGKFVDVPELQKIVIVNKESLKLLLQQIAPHNRLSFASHGISNIIWALGKLVTEPSLQQLVIDNQASLDLLLKQINPNNILSFKSQEISNIIWGLGKLVVEPKLQQLVIYNQASLDLLLQKIAPNNILSFTAQEISNIIWGLSRLVAVSDLRQLVIDNEASFELLLQQINQIDGLSFNSQKISMTIWCLAKIGEHVPFSKKSASCIVKSCLYLFRLALNKQSSMTMGNRIHIMHGLINFVQNNIITFNKPNKESIRTFYLNHIIENPELIKNDYLPINMYLIAFYQEYLTKEELITILKDIDFIKLPTEIRTQTRHFSNLSYLLVKIRNELKDDSENKDLIDLATKLTTAIQTGRDKLLPDIKKLDDYLLTAMYFASQLIGEEEIFAKVKINIDPPRTSELQREVSQIMKELLAEGVTITIEATKKHNSIPVDILLRLANGVDIAIEICGPGHYIDPEGSILSGVTIMHHEIKKQEYSKLIELNFSQHTSRDKMIAYTRRELFINDIPLKP
jgi:hypothetical protein